VRVMGAFTRNRDGDTRDDGLSDNFRFHPDLGVNRGGNWRGSVNGIWPGEWGVCSPGERQGLALRSLLL
jgi:hypothetical protein